MRTALFADYHSQCHSANFAKGELAKSDEMIRNADHLMAEGIRDLI